MTDQPTNFRIVHAALKASLADDGITLPVNVTMTATQRILDRLNATTRQEQS